METGDEPRTDRCTSTLRIPGIVSYYTYLTVKLLSGFRTHGNTIKIVVQACGFQIVFLDYNILLRLSMKG